MDQYGYKLDHCVAAVARTFVLLGKFDASVLTASSRAPEC